MTFRKIVFLMLLILSGALLAPSQEKSAPTVQPKKFMINPNDGVIDETQAAFIKRTVERAKKEKPDLVIFEVGTPGGRVDAAIAMSIHIMSLKPIPTVAFIKPSREDMPLDAAASAGVLISISCERIYMYPASVIGASQVIMLSPSGPVELPESIEEKETSFLREKYSEVAKINGYPQNLIIMMVDRKWEEVYEVTAGNKKMFLTDREIEKYEMEKKVKLEKPNNSLRKQGKLLTLGAQDAVSYGVATRIIRDRTEIYPDYQLGNPVEIQEGFTWSEGMVGWLTHPMVRLVLIALGILGIWVELKTPGFGVPGVVGILAFALVLFGQNLAGLAEAPEIALVILGLLLIVVELFVLPGTGIFAIGGIVCFFIGLILSMSFQGPSWPEGEFAWQSLKGPALTAFGAFVIASTVVFLLLRFLPHVPMFNRMALHAEITSTSVEASEAMFLMELVSKTGVAVTSLRPAGKVDVGGDTIDVTTRGEFIEKGETVQVIQVEANHIIVSRPGIT